jgi:hypothetical protein
MGALSGPKVVPCSLTERRALAARTWSPSSAARSLPSTGVSVIRTASPRGGLACFHAWPPYRPSLSSSSKQSPSNSATCLPALEITRVLQQAEIYKDVLPGETKWKRLLTAFKLQQRADGNGNRVARATEITMDPVRYTAAPEQFAIRREQMNTILAFSGMQLAEDGHLRRTDSIKTLTEAQRRAKSLYQRLAQRGAHSLVLKYCTAELLADNYFHAVLERLSRTS